MAHNFSGSNPYPPSDTGLVSRVQASRMASLLK
ncbi:Uncharacterised protein [Mycobacteroides abscessus subsp. abscessus]|nr:Uncharacterised protein [Mycobacteroides abscessus subsp. abscessus]